MDYGLTEEQVMIRDLCRQIAEEKIKPVREAYDESGEFPWDLVKVFADADLFGLAIEEEYGGMGGGVMDTVIAVEELSKAFLVPGLVPTRSCSLRHLNRSRSI
jgi:alkylation response protein AidB-like acyl-CoA dehydrogenase